MLLAFAFALLTAAAPLQDPPEGVVRGVVRSQATGEPLASAVVELVGAPRRVVSSDEDGAYVLRRVPAGRQLVRARHIGHDSLEVEVVVPPGRDVRVDIGLPSRPVALDPVAVQAGGAAGAGVDTLAAGAPELSIAGARALEGTPGLAELGLADAARGAPGNEPVDPTDVLYVRGAAADLKVVFLDGAPVYAPFPLGGLLEPFTPGLLQSAEVYLGGAPARYDGGLSYILDLRTRGVRRSGAHSSGALDVLSARGSVETALPGGAGLLLAGRGLHRLGTRALVPYGYREGLGRADVPLGRTGVLSVTGFTNGEEVWLGGGGAPDSVIDWGNTAVSLRYRGTFGRTGAELTAATGSFRARLPLDGRQPIVVSGQARRSRLAADFARPAGPASVRYGLAYERQEQSYESMVRTSALMAGRFVSSRAAGSVLGAYVDASWAAAPRVRLRGGLRADHFSLGSELVLAPRLSASWLVTDRAALTVAGGAYHQYLRAPEAALLARAAAVDSAEALSSDALAVGRSAHLAVSLDQQVGDELRLGLEGFYKSFDGVPGTSSTAANASGVDVWVRRPTGRVTGWLGYSLAWVWSAGAGETAERFAGRHLLSAGLGAPVGEHGRLDLGFAYGAGLPYSGIPLATSGITYEWTSPTTGATDALRNASSGGVPLLRSPDRPYLRLDVAASRTWTPRWGGARVEVTPYVRVLNTLGRRDALFYHYDRQRDDPPRALASLPLVPVLGMQWEF